jgi:Holliday junction resolvasome RuvABC endonuclease subunit
MSYLLGIDPGKKGGIALLNADKPSAVYCVETWVMPDTTRALHDLMAGLPIIKVCGLEKPFYPKMIGMANAAKIAEAYGVIKGALAWRDIPFREVRPVEWKKSLNVSTDKNVARQRASEFFPDNADQWKLAKEDGRAEAALIAWFCMRWA